MTTTAKQLREAADEFERLTAPGRMPTMDEVHRFMESNPVTATEMLTAIRCPSAETDRCSNGRLRDLWKTGGGSVDRQGRAFIEIDLLPGLLRYVIDGVPPSENSSGK